MIMKKIIKVLVIISLTVINLVIFTGCTGDTSSAIILEKETDTCYFVTIQECNTYRVVYDPNTKVMYIVSWGNDNRGIVTMLVNADGTPLLYKE